ncbi:M23 family metallopeptidase [Streptomyces sp. NPDC002454]
MTTDPQRPALLGKKTPAPSSRRPATRTLHKVLNRTYRTVLLLLLALIAASFVVDRLNEPPFPLLWPLLGLTALIVLFLARLTGPSRRRTTRPADEPVDVAPPVTGRWTAVNSPADKVPSHGTHSYGQTYAIDIVAEPAATPDPTAPARPAASDAPADRAAPRRPPFAWFWPLIRRPDAYPAHGAPLFAVADATVVRAQDTQRDHLSRSSLPMLAYLMVVEAPARALWGPTRVTGNHLVLDLGDGTYALYCHLRRGSLRVRVGDRVHLGQPVAATGNSGNSTEPHLHFQLMDASDLDEARGVPFRWHGVGLPANGETFTVEARREEVTPG